MLVARWGRTLGAVLGVVSASAARSHAAEGPGTTTTLPCRPTIACTAEFVPPGAFELELGYQYRRLGDARQSTTPFLAKLTVARFLQLQVGGNGVTGVEGPAPSHYFDDVTLGLKVHLLDASKVRPSVSFSFALSVPTVAEPGYLRTYDAFTTAYVTKDLGPVHADLNLGYNRWAVDSTPRSQEWVALALSTTLPPPFGVMVESYYFTDAAPVSTRDGGFLFAVSHSPVSWLTFDLGGDVGYFPGTRSFSAFFGMSIVPFVLWKAR